MWCQRLGYNNYCNLNKDYNKNMIMFNYYVHGPQSIIANDIGTSSQLTSNLQIVLQLPFRMKIHNIVPFHANIGLYHLQLL